MAGLSGGLYPEPQYLDDAIERLRSRLRLDMDLEARWRGNARSGPNAAAAARVLAVVEAENDRLDKHLHELLTARLVARAVLDRTSYDQREAAGGLIV